MCFLSKKTKKRLDEIQTSVNELTKIVKTQELERLRKESEELKNIKKLLSNIRLHVKKVEEVQDGDIQRKVKIVYELPIIILKYDDNGKLIKNNFFYSINALDLISYDDMKRISKVLERKEGK